MKKLLYTRKSDCIRPLRALVEAQNHRTLVRWALDAAPEFLALFERDFPGDDRPRAALRVAEAWARGEVKMPAAKRAIHAAHNAAKAAGEAGNIVAESAARAVGHAAATVHVETHALGLVFYGLTALNLDTPEASRDGVIDAALGKFYGRLEYFAAHPAEVDGLPWAAFLQKDAPNKERLLHERELADEIKG